LHNGIALYGASSRDVVQLLMERGADVHAEKFDRLTPMQLAIRDHGEECAMGLFKIEVEYTIPVT
jgi:hypothetical protein